LSGSSPLTCLAWEDLPVAYATANIALGIMWPHKPHHYVKVRIQLIHIYKVKFTLEPPNKAQRGVDEQLYYVFSLGARKDGWLRPCLCRPTPESEPVSTAWEAGTYALIRSSNWIGRGASRLRCVYALSCVVCDVCALCASEPRFNYCQGNIGFKFRLILVGVWGLFLILQALCAYCGARVKIIQPPLPFKFFYVYHSIIILKFCVLKVLLNYKVVEWITN
jgi:hypothetical protein